RFVRQVDLVAREALLARRNALVGEQAEDRVAGDAAEHGRERRRLHRSLAHDEDVLAARLGDVAVDIEEEGLVVARGARLARGQLARTVWRQASTSRSRGYGIASSRTCAEP